MEIAKVASDLGFVLVALVIAIFPRALEAFLALRRRKDDADK
jgi:hypothetical protein